MVTMNGLNTVVRSGVKAVQKAVHKDDNKIEQIKSDIKEAEKALLDNMTPTLDQKVMHAGAIALAFLKFVFTGFSKEARENLKHTWRSTPVSEKAAEKIMEALQKIIACSEDEVNFELAVDAICQDEIDQSYNPKLKVQSTSKETRIAERTKALTHLIDSKLTAADLTLSNNDSNPKVRQFQHHVANLTPPRRESEVLTWREELDLLFGI